jgi:hypothetical protein
VRAASLELKKLWRPSDDRQRAVRTFIPIHKEIDDINFDTKYGSEVRSGSPDEHKYYIIQSRNGKTFGSKL